MKHYGKIESGQMNLFRKQQNFCEKLAERY